MSIEAKRCYALHNRCPEMRHLSLHNKELWELAEPVPSLCPVLPWGNCLRDLRVLSAFAIDNVTHHQTEALVPRPGAVSSGHSNSHRKPGKVKLTSASSWSPATMLSFFSFSEDITGSLVSLRKLVSRNAFPLHYIHQLSPQPPTRNPQLLNWLQSSGRRMQTHPIFSHRWFPQICKSVFICFGDPRVFCKNIQNVSIFKEID